MKNFRANFSMHRQQGVNLIELMIGLTIGLVMLIALSYFLLGSRQLNRTHDDVSRMQESGRYALEILGRAIRQAGYRNNTDVEGNVPFVGAVAGTDAVSPAPDTITAQYTVQDGGELNCAGVNVASGRVTYAFSVAGNQLLCSTIAPAAGVAASGGVVVADNIESMQIMYGIDSTRDGVIDTYISAPTAAEFAQVAAVRVDLLVRGPTANVAANNQTYVFAASSVTPSDRFLRQVYTATFTVRNQAR